jgi:succinate dehydrogenase / fumarate reductase cytochrome b subunit
VFKKQIVAVTGLMLVGFILGHLAGNFLVFAGPEALNAYAEKLRSYGPLLWGARLGLIAAVLVHIVLAVVLYFENRSARGGATYAVDDTEGATTFAKRTMILTGLLIVFFVFVHLNDFTFADKYGDESVVEGYNNGESLGLYGVVWNGFLQPWRVVFYVLALAALGLHLSHGIQSFAQTLGFNDADVLPRLERFALVVGTVVALAYIAIPVYVVVRHMMAGPPV